MDDLLGAGSGTNSTGMTNAARVDLPRERMNYVTFGAAEESRIGSVYWNCGLGAAVT